MKTFEEEIIEGVKLWRPRFYKKPIEKENLDELVKIVAFPILKWAEGKKCPIKKNHPKECHYPIALGDLIDYLKQLKGLRKLKRKESQENGQEKKSYANLKKIK